MYIDKQQILDKLIIDKNSKKCFIFDLDGTIIFNNKFLSHDNEVILKQIEDAGHELVFATGRSLNNFKTVMPSWTHNKALTLFSGGVSINNHVLLRSCAIDHNSVEEILNICTTCKYPFVIDSYNHYYHPNIENMYCGILDGSKTKYRMLDIKQIANDDIYKILILDINAMNFFTQYALKNNLLIKHHSYENCFDIVSMQSNKYLGVEPFISNYELRDVFVFGNDYNDYELFTNFNNSILFGDIAKLQAVTKVNLVYNNNLQHNFRDLIHTIIKDNIC